MDTEIFEPEMDENHRYALAVPTEIKVMRLLATYETIDLLRKGYEQWKRYADSKGIRGPYPIEILDESRKSRILTDIVNGK